MVNMRNPFKRDHPALDGLKRLDDPNGVDAAKALDEARRASKELLEARQTARVAFLTTQQKEPFVHNSDVQSAQFAVTERVEQVAPAEDADVDQSGITTKELV